MDKYTVVDRVSTNRSDVTFMTEDDSVVLVSVYGSGVGFLSDSTVIGIAKVELKRKIDSDYFCLVNVRLSERRQKNEVDTSSESQMEINFEGPDLKLRKLLEADLGYFSRRKKTDAAH